MPGSGQRSGRPGHTSPEARRVLPGAPGRASLDAVKRQSRQIDLRSRPCGGTWLVSETTGEVRPARCKSWLCEHCNRRLAGQARRYLAHGARERPERTRLAMFTLTDGSAGALDFAAMRRVLDNTRRDFRRRGWWRDYGGAVELQKRGALHVHLLAVVDHDAPIAARQHGHAKRDRRAYAWHFGELVPALERLGWGPVADVVDVTSIDRATGYAAKALASYATKSNVAMLKRAAAVRVRPVRASRGWAEGLTMADFAEPVSDDDPGPWRPARSLRVC